MMRIPTRRDECRKGIAGVKVKVGLSIGFTSKYSHAALLLPQKRHVRVTYFIPSLDRDDRGHDPRSENKWRPVSQCSAPIGVKASPHYEAVAADVVERAIATMF